MTPPQTRKAAPRNTSAVPRTRKMAKPPVAKVSEIIVPTIEVPPPETPRSIPLPPPAGTPYEVVTPRVTPQVVLSTPRGPVSLHKALLLRSARKAWEESRSPGVEGAIEVGDIEVRRKSLSPKRGSPKKSLTPMPVEEEADHEDEDSGLPFSGELQWIHEDGRAEATLDDSDSDMDSFEADMSLDNVSQCEKDALGELI